MINRDNLWETIVFILLTVAGSFARLLHVGGKGTLTIGRVLGEIFIAGVGGFIVVLVGRGMGLRVEYVGALAGVAGLGGPSIVFALPKLVGKLTGVDLGKTEEKEE